MLLNDGYGTFRRGSSYEELAAAYDLIVRRPQRWCQVELDAHKPNFQLVARFGLYSGCKLSHMKRLHGLQTTALEELRAAVSRNPRSGRSCDFATLRHKRSGLIHTLVTCA